MGPEPILRFLASFSLLYHTKEPHLRTDIGAGSVETVTELTLKEDPAMVLVRAQGGLRFVNNMEYKGYIRLCKTSLFHKPSIVIIVSRLKIIPGMEHCLLVGGKL